jgi:sulfopyruvate decarboxylase subunit alpha
MAVAGSEIIAALKQANIEFIVALPDIVTSQGLLWPIARGNDFKLVRLCKEDEGVSICAALALAGHRAALLMQHTGLLDSINAIRGIACELQQPVCMIVGLLAKGAGVAPRQSQSSASASSNRSWKGQCLPYSRLSRAIPCRRIMLGSTRSSAYMN